MHVVVVCGVEWKQAIQTTGLADPFSGKMLGRTGHGQFMRSFDATIAAATSLR